MSLSLALVDLIMSLISNLVRCLVIIESIPPLATFAVTSPFADLIRRINPFAYALKPALAVVTIVIIIFVATAIIKLPSENSEVVKVDPDNQIECMNYLLGVFDQDSMNGNNDFGTSIEEYFL